LPSDEVQVQAIKESNKIKGATCCNESVVANEGDIVGTGQSASTVVMKEIGSAIAIT